MIPLLFLGFQWLASSPPETFCALRFEVSDAAGKPLSAQYRLVDSVGNVAASGIAKGGQAEICDWDFGVYSLKVWMGGYYETVTNPVHFIYGESQVFKIVLNAYDKYGKEPYGCSCYYRVKDASGGQLSGVKVTAGEQTLYSDAYGRVRVWTPGHKDEVVRFEKEGYVAAIEKMNCTKAVQKNSAYYVVMKRSP